MNNVTFHANNSHLLASITALNLFIANMLVEFGSAPRDATILLIEANQTVVDVWAVFRSPLLAEVISLVSLELSHL